MDIADRNALIALIDEYAENRERAYLALSQNKPRQKYVDDAERLARTIIDTLDKV